MSEAISPESPQTNAAAPPVAPVVETAAPAVEVAPVEVSVTETPAVETPVTAEATFLNVEPSVEAKPAEEKPKDKVPDVKVEDKKPDAVEQKKEEAVQSDEPAPLPTYEPFTLPEGVKLDDARMGEFTKDLGEFQALTKADQKSVQEFGQKLVDKYVAESQENVKRISEHYVNAWEKQKSDWKDALEKDPEIGGNRIQTTKSSIQKALAKAPAEQLKAFSEYMNSSGIGNNPDVIRVISYLANKVNAYEQETAKPLAGTKPPSPKSSIYETFYGKKSG